MTLWRTVTIRERFTSGKRKFVEMSEAFESDQGQALRYEDARALGLRLLLNCTNPQETELEGGCVLPCRAALGELAYALGAFPACSGRAQSMLKDWVFGPVTHVLRPPTELEEQSEIRN